MFDIHYTNKLHFKNWYTISKFPRVLTPRFWWNGDSHWVRVKGFPKQCARHTGVSFSLWLPLLRTHSNESKPLSKQTSSTDFTSCKTNIDPCIRTLCSFIHPSNNETHHSRRFKRILHEHNVCSPNMHFAVSRPQCYCFFWAYFDKSATKSSLNSRSISVDNT